MVRGRLTLESLDVFIAFIRLTLNTVLNTVCCEN